MSDDLYQYALVADVYDFVHPYRNRPDIHVFVEAAMEAGSPVLELGCGTGRVLIPMARAGITITGLDASPHMLAVCRQRLSNESVNVRSRVTVLQGDMRDFTIDVGAFCASTAAAASTASCFDAPVGEAHRVG